MRGKGEFRLSASWKIIISPRSGEILWPIFRRILSSCDSKLSSVTKNTLLSVPNESLTSNPPCTAIVCIHEKMRSCLTFQCILGYRYFNHITDIFYLRGGISTNPTLSSFGFGLQMKNFKMDISSSFHQTLGITPGISLIYQKKKTPKKVEVPSI